MKKVKKISIIGILIMAFLIQPGYAATEEQNKAGNQLRLLNIYRGYEDGTLQLDNQIRRSEMATLMVRTLGYENQVVVGREPVEFSDVTNDYWANDMIQKASQLKLFAGYPDGSFQPEANISYAETLALMIRALNMDGTVTGEWPNNYIAKAKELHIISQDSAEDPGQPVTRGEVAVFIWNTLLVKYK